MRVHPNNLKNLSILLFFCLFVAGNLFADNALQGVDEFDELMGKTTPHWRHVAQPQDKQTLEYAKTIYFKNKLAQFVEEGPYKIPPVIHFIWLGPRPFPPQSVENVRTWMSQNPGWKVKFWTDRDREPPCEGMEKILVRDFNFLKLGKCFEESQNWGEKSDLLRYEILYQQGGVYADHDANCLKSFSGMNRGYDFFCGLETPHEAFAGRSVTCGNGVIGARPRHPTVGNVIDLIAERWQMLAEKYRGNDDYSRIEVVMQRTYIALTQAIAETIDRDGNIDIVLPAAFFFSKSGITPLYSKHFYATAWDEFKGRKSDIERVGEKTLGKIRRKNLNLIYLIFGLILFNGLMLGISLYKGRKLA
jgi:hypothetical protein